MSGVEPEDLSSSVVESGESRQGLDPGGVEEQGPDPIGVACPHHTCTSASPLITSASESRRVSECIGAGHLGDDPTALIQPGSNVTRYAHLSNT